MERVGVIGLGAMGIGIARNLLAAGFPTTGTDLRPERLELLGAAGGTPVPTCAEVGECADALFVMVLNGTQARDALLGPDGALGTMRTGGTVMLTATILPSEVRSLQEPLSAKGVHLIDTPVSGGKSGADNGTLTLMAAAESPVLERSRRVLEAISNRIFHVGEDIGQGQTVKAALQAFIGCLFASTFESLVMGVNAGVKGETLFDVIRASAAGSPLFEHCARQVLDRKFEGTGSGIGTMYKDLGISMSVARDAGAAMFSTSSAYELFQAGMSRYPAEDNWAVAKILEEIAGQEATW